MWVFTGIKNLAYIHRQKRCLHRDQENMSQSFLFVVSSYEGLFKMTKINQDMNLDYIFFHKFVITTFIYIDNQVEAVQVKVGCVEMRRKVEKCILDAVFCSSVGPNIYFSQDKK